jgi:hypothetical protein
VTEDLVDLGPRRLGVLDGVVQQRRDDRGIVELEIGQDRRDLQRMGEIGVARRTGLRAVSLQGVDLGPVEQILVGIRIVGTYPFHKVILPHHPRPRRLRRPRLHRLLRRRDDRIGRGVHLRWALARSRHESKAFISENGTQAPASGAVQSTW